MSDTTNHTCTTFANLQFSTLIQVENINEIVVSDKYTCNRYMLLKLNNKYVKQMYFLLIYESYHIVVWMWMKVKF